MINRIRNLFASLAAFAAMSVPALASAGDDFRDTSGGGLSVPELDPTSAASAVALLIGAALLVHRARRSA